MSQEFLNKCQEHFCEHEIFKPGQRVHILKSFSDIHPLSPIAGRVLVVCKTLYLSSDDPMIQQAIDSYEQVSPLSRFVSVRHRNEIWSVEQEYVEVASEEQSEREL